jgi:hypothetical protein
MKTIVSFFYMVLLLFPHIAHSQEWYFDKDSIGGMCSNTGAGTITQPFCNIMTKVWDSSWNGAQAGDTIYIRQGTYTGRTFWIHAGALQNGTPSQPITIRPYPGETVVFDGLNVTDMWMKLAATGTETPEHDLKFVGPFEVKGYSNAIEGGRHYTERKKNLYFENFDVHDGGGFIFRTIEGLTVKNSTFHDLRGLPTSISDNNVGVSIRGDSAYPTNLSDDILIEGCTFYNINDGKGEALDADGLHTDQHVNHLTVRNCTAYNCSEDGFDTKAREVILENLISHDNGATGIKMWGGNINIQSNYKMTNALIYSNKETGLKCTGWGDAANNQVTAVVDNLTSWGNGENNVKLSPGTDTSQGCTVTLRNTILGRTNQSDIEAYTVRTGYSSTLNLDHTLIYHTGTEKAIEMSGCSPLSEKYSSAEYLSGLFNSDLIGGVNCGGAWGSVTGTSVSPYIYDPSLTDPGPVFEWGHISTAAVTSNTVTLSLSGDGYVPWIYPTNGHYIEFENNGQMYQIVSSDMTTRTITFTPSVPAPLYGKLSSGGEGVMIKGWETSTIATKNFALSGSSPALDAGIFVPGIHCAQADDNGGSALTGCVHWSGSAPELGFAYFGDYVPPPADTTKPVVTAFTIPSTSTSLTVPITTFTATDNNTVTGYQVNESSTAPVASGSGWHVSRPASYIAATQGSKTLYAWAIDGSGNVSLSMSASVTITVVAPSSGQARLQGAGHAKLQGAGHATIGN